MEKPKKVVGVYDRPKGNNRMRIAAIVLVVVVVVGAVILLLAS